MTRVELRHVEALIAIAEAGTISGAANHLHVSQPTLSRTLAQLESIVDVLLVERSTHHLALTPAGRRFLDLARPIPATLDAAVVAARAARHPIHLAYPWSTNDVVTVLLAAWERDFPDLRVEATYSEEARQRLLDGEADLALVRAETSAELAVVALDVESRWAALPRRHRLARRASVELADLSQDTIVTSDHGTTRLEMWPVDARPTSSIATASTDAWMVEIARGRGVGVTVTSIARSRPHPDIRYIPLVDAPQIALQLARRRKSANPILKRLQTSAARAMRAASSASSEVGSRAGRTSQRL